MDTDVLHAALNRANIVATNSQEIILPEYRKLSDAEKFMYGLHNFVINVM